MHHLAPALLRDPTQHRREKIGHGEDIAQRRVRAAFGSYPPPIARIEGHPAFDAWEVELHGHRAIYRTVGSGDITVVLLTLGIVLAAVLVVAFLVPDRQRGETPEVELASWALALPPAYAAPLRLGSPPVVGRVERGRLLLDLRCVPPELDDVVADAIRAAAV